MEASGKGCVRQEVSYHYPFQLIEHTHTQNNGLYIWKIIEKPDYMLRMLQRLDHIYNVIYVMKFHGIIDPVMPVVKRFYDITDPTQILS